MKIYNYPYMIRKVHRDKPRNSENILRNNYRKEKEKEIADMTLYYSYASGLVNHSF